MITAKFKTLCLSIILALLILVEAAMLLTPIIIAIFASPEWLLLYIAVYVIEAPVSFVIDVIIYDLICEIKKEAES